MCTSNTGFGESGDASVSSVFHSGTSDLRDCSMQSSDKVCNFCHKRGHLWKFDCVAFKAKSKDYGAEQYVWPCLCLIIAGKSLMLFHLLHQMVLFCWWEVRRKCQLRFCVTAWDFFIQASVLSFSEESDTGCSVPVLGSTDLFQGKVASCCASGTASWGHWCCAKIPFLPAVFSSCRKMVRSVLYSLRRFISVLVFWKLIILTRVRAFHFFFTCWNNLMPSTTSH